MQVQRFMQISDYALTAHANHPRQPNKAWRKAGVGTIPYGVHPLWCATTILQENALPSDIRDLCAIALLLHDMLEDTTAALPEGLTPEEIELIEELTFYGGSCEEMGQIWSKSELAILCKAYDKASNLFDLSFMEPANRDAYKAYAHTLADHVEKRWGNLVIIRMIRALA